MEHSITTTIYFDTIPKWWRTKGEITQKYNFMYYNLAWYYLVFFANNTIESWYYFHKNLKVNNNFQWEFGGNPRGYQIPKVIFLEWFFPCEQLIWYLKQQYSNGGWWNFKWFSKQISYLRFASMYNISGDTSLYCLGTNQWNWGIFSYQNRI